MASTTNSTTNFVPSASSSSSLCRRSKRKRLPPVRYGFDGNTTTTNNNNNNNNNTGSNKRRRITNNDNGNSMLDYLPIELVRQSLSFLSGVSDRYALQTTNKLFKNLSNSTEIIQNMPLLLTSRQQQDGTAVEAATETEERTTTTTIIQPNDTANVVTRRLVPFVQTGNRDGIFLLALVAIYQEDDTGTGLALLQKGMEDLGDLRCQHEIGNFLKLTCRNPNDATRGRQLLMEAAAAGHAPSRVATKNSTTTTTAVVSRSERRAIYQTAKEEIAGVTNCMKHLMDQKSDPPNPEWKGHSCGYPECFRRYYNVQYRAVRHWLKQRKNQQQYTQHWQQIRAQVYACGIPFPTYKQDRRSLYFVPPFQICSQCRSKEYCSRTCQVLHWNQHKLFCIPAAVINAAAAQAVNAAAAAAAAAAVVQQAAAAVVGGGGGGAPAPPAAPGAPPGGGTGGGGGGAVANNNNNNNNNNDDDDDNDNDAQRD